jgi:hypothetical protein
MWRWMRLVNRCATILSIHRAFIMHSFSPVHSPLGDLSDVDAAGAWLPRGVWVGSGVSEVMAAFVASLAAM